MGLKHLLTKLGMGCVSMSSEERGNGGGGGGGGGGVVLSV